MSEDVTSDDNGDVLCRVDLKWSVFTRDAEFLSHKCPETYKHMVEALDNGWLLETGRELCIESCPKKEIRFGFVVIKHDTVNVRVHDCWDDIEGLCQTMNADDAWVRERAPVHQDGFGVEIVTEFETPGTARELIEILDTIEDDLIKESYSRWKEMELARINMAINAMAEAVGDERTD